MSTVYLTSQGATLHKEGKTLVLEGKDNLRHVIFPFQVEQIFIIGRINITTPAMHFILANSIDTVFLSSNGSYLGRLEGKINKNIYLRKMQFKKFENEDFLLNTAKIIVKGKIYNSIILLKRIFKKRKEKELKEIIKTIEEIYKRIDNSQTLNSLRGHEGKSAALYFRGLKYGFNKKNIYFAKRVRRPPTDPVNAVLSLLYTILMNRIFGAVCSAGLDPYLGALHSVEYGRPSLVLDLMEEFRIILVDSLVLSLFNLKILDKDDFIIKDISNDNEIDFEYEIHEYNELPDIPDVVDRAVLLKEKALKNVISQFERKLETEFFYEPLGKRIQYRKALFEQAKLFASYIRDERISYKPVLLQ